MESPQQPPTPIPFRDAAMVPSPGDSAALAKRLLPPGTRISLEGAAGDDGGTKVVTLTSPCPEGHRFALIPRAPGQPLLSWGLPFGIAVSPGIKSGDVLMNGAMAKALRGRLTGGHHGEEGEAIAELLERQGVNFEDVDVSPDHPFQLDKCELGVSGTNRPGIREDAQEDEGEEGTFMGYRRSHGRGVGTRNHVAVIGLTSSASPVLLPLSDRWRNREYEPTTSGPASRSDGSAAEKRPRQDFDGVRIVAHTEGESPTSAQHNMTHIHRCLAGFLVHPNIGAAVVVTTGRERHISRETLMEFVAQSNAEAEKKGKGPVYPLWCFEPPFCTWVRIRGGPSAAVRKLDAAVRDAVEHATDQASRVPCPLRELSIALQCGGSDAFSGLTGNPLAGAMASHFILRHGSRAVLAESPELVGAEPYILSRVASKSVAEDFIRTTESYKGYAARHGQSAAGNPSGGNLYRGLYNIVLKSLGAARKKAPEVALDRVLKYGEPMPSQPPSAVADEGEVGSPHYAFMDSPGNDLESIAGQVSTGCNLILFITGNGALTNFPFVPTLKIVTTSRRHKLLEHEMDINAGPYGHGGEDRDKAIAFAVSLAERVAGGERTKGEGAGHSQVNLWRNWAVDQQQNGWSSGCGNNKASALGEADKLELCSDRAPHPILPLSPNLPADLLQEGPFRRKPVGEGMLPATPLRPWSVGSTYTLIPTSLCSSAIASTVKDSIAAKEGKSVPRIACPSHTEGCGASGDVHYERTLQRLLLGHALHPSVSRALFLEHGCEKTHNDYFRNSLRECGALGEGEEMEDAFEFWSLQADGGFDNAKEHAAEYFLHRPWSANDNAGAESVVRPLFGVPWSDRPISVGIMVDPAAAVVTEGDSAKLASALASVVRYLSERGVHTVLPVDSILLSALGGANAPRRRGGTPPESRTTAADGDMEDLFAPRPSSEPAGSGTPSGVRPPARDSKPLGADGSISDGSISAAFLVEALGSAATDAAASAKGVPPGPTLLPAQMIGVAKHPGRQREPPADEERRGGLHVMDLPRSGGATWDETISCLGPACDALLLVGATGEEASELPGSGLVPTLRMSTPTSGQGTNDGKWQDWTAEICRRLVEVLRSPLVCGGTGGVVAGKEKRDHGAEEVERLREELFTVTTFVVPRGNAVSL